MSGYQDIEVVKCPNPDEIFKLLSIFERTEIKESLRPSNIFRQNSSHKSELEDLNIIDLASYQTTLNEKNLGIIGNVIMGNAILFWKRLLQTLAVVVMIYFL